MASEMPETHGYLPSRTASPPIDRYQIILLGDRDTGVSNLPRCFDALRQLRTIRRSVPDDTFQGLVVSRLDYRNVTLAGLPAYLLNHLQAY